MLPTRIDVAGVPEIVGAPLLGVGDGDGAGAGALPPPAVIENAGNVALDFPSVTVIRMFLHVPACGALPFNRPEYTLNCAQLGLLAIE